MSSGDYSLKTTDLQNLECSTLTVLHHSAARPAAVDGVLFASSHSPSSWGSYVPLNLSMLVDLGREVVPWLLNVYVYKRLGFEKAYMKPTKLLFGILSCTFLNLVPWDSSPRCSAWARS